MEIKELHGLTVALADVREALDTDWETHRGHVEIVRVIDPPESSRRALAQAGFFIKPSWLTWVADACDSEARFLAGLRRKERQNVNTARRRMAEAGVVIDVVPLDAPLLDAFLDLYRRQVATMRNAFPVAVQQREQLLSRAAEFFVVRAVDGDTVVGACISQCLPEVGLVRLRFSAVDEPGRDRSLSRVMYVRALSEARTRGLRQVSLGNDPNLYGHIVETGLFDFKSRLGFTAVPSQGVAPFAGNDTAELILDRSALSYPSLFLSYEGEADGPPMARTLRMEYLGHADSPDLPRYASAFPGEVRVHPWV
ncbi:GNAT family N-acetyltransferase [Streptomyces sp. NPDC059456]|uniref:GNAT family N-acetyltransferase n=1 Tax=Streptomyces sp. NPDC059456 TaxID=3346838 RepID=UPI003695046F